MSDGPGGVRVAAMQAGNGATVADQAATMTAGLDVVHNGSTTVHAGLDTVRGALRVEPIHLDAHSFEPSLKPSFENSKRQGWLGDKAGLLQEDSAGLQRHAIQEGWHFLLGAPHTIPSRRMLMVL